MDIFNKKKIRELESRIADLEVEDKSIWAYCEQEFKKLKELLVKEILDKIELKKRKEEYEPKRNKSRA